MIKKMKVSKKQYDVLIALLVNLKVLKVYNSNDDEKETCRCNIKAIFETLDYLKVSFKAQNKIIAIVDNNKREYLLESYNSDLLNCFFEIV
jgi:hypothetical protein